MSVSCSGPTRVRAGGAFGSWRDGPRGIASRSGRVGPFVPCRSRKKKHFAKNKKEGTKRASALRAAAEGKPSGPSARGERIVGEVVSRLRPSLSPPRRRRLVSPSLLAKKHPFSLWCVSHRLARFVRSGETPPRLLVPPPREALRKAPPESRRATLRLAASSRLKKIDKRRRASFVWRPGSNPVRPAAKSVVQSSCSSKNFSRAPPREPRDRK